MNAVPVSARRTWLMGAASLCVVAWLPTGARAVSFDALTNADATSGLKAALDQGSAAAIGKLGVAGGFFDNPQVKIPLPPALARVERALRFAGMQDRADQLVASMNQAAEQAVPLARPLLANAVRSMTVTDAKKILTGGDTSVTEFFKEKTAAPLTERFLPIVKQQTDQVGLAQQYNHLAGQGVALGLIDEADASIERYVTQKALDGLFLMIGEEERAIRDHPLDYGSQLIAKVFGALKQ